MKINNKYMTLPVFIAFVGAILSAIGAIWSSIKQTEESDQNNILTRRLAEKSDEIAKKATNMQLE